MNFIATYIVFFSLFFGLNNERIEYVSYQTSQDSLSIWIEKARDKNIDSIIRKELLRKAYNHSMNEKNDSLRNISLVKISYTYYKFDDSLAFRKVNKESIMLSKKLNDSIILAANYWDLGRFYSNNALLDSAYYSFSKAQRIYESLKNNHYSARMLLNMAISQSDAKDFTGSEITTVKAISVLKPLQAYEQLYRCYNNLGVNFNNLEDYEKAIESHNIALEYERKVKGKNTFRENTLNNIGVVNKNKKEYQKAIRNYEEALKSKTLKEQNIKLYAKLLDNFAYSKFKLNDTTGVKDLFNKSLRIRDSIHDYLSIAVNKLHLAEYYVSIDDSVKAKQFALEGKKIARETKNFRELLPTLLLLSEVDKKNSLDYTNQYIRLSDSLQKEERSIRNKFARIRFETDEFIDENERLNRQQNLIILISSIVVLFGILLYVIKYQRSRNKELLFEHRQQKTNEEIYSLMLNQQDKLEEGRKKEKKRISEELHDGVLGRLFGTRLILGTLNDSNDDASIAEREKYLSDLQEIEEEVRNVSHELNNESIISNTSYTHLVEDLLENQSRIGNFVYQSTYDEAIVWDEVSSGLKMNLYRIIQEAIQNINKYAKADTIHLEFKIDKNHLSMSIKDDGIGFNTETKRKGIGLKNMNSRVAKFNGNLTVNSKRGSGTLVVVIIPLNI